MLTCLNQYLLSPSLTVGLLGGGIFYLIYLRGYPFRRPLTALGAMLPKRGADRTASPFRAVCTALAGTLGVGNILGVATAITAGGPGAVFWMWIAALLSMILKYAEILSSMLYRTDRGGTPYTVEKALHKPRLAALFSVLCLFTAFPLGNILQLQAAAEAANCFFSLPYLTVGIPSAVILFFVLCRGQKRVGDFTSAVIPLLCSGYMAMSLCIVFANRALLPSIFSDIFHSAFTLPAAAGGTGGFLITRLLSAPAMRFGIARGLLSNEAGCGTAPFAHADADNHPVKQGLLGIFEVFFDTVVLCTLTALVILIYLPQLPYATGIALAVSAFGCYYGGAAPIILTVSVYLFAISSAVSWGYYGLSCVDYLSAKARYRNLFCAAYILCAVLGLFLPSDFIIDLTDSALAIMTLLNLFVLLILSPKVKQHTLLFFKGTKKERP